MVFLTAILSFFCSDFVTGYSPQITGRFEAGDRIDTYYTSEGKEEFFDKYDYLRFWLRYRQQLAPGEYYFIRGQYFRRDNQVRKNFSNITLDVWSNYTFYLTESIRNRINFDIKDKDYFYNENNSHFAYNLKYQIDYEFSQVNDYTLFLQRRWQDYKKATDKDNVTYIFAIDWNYQLKDNLNITTGLRFDRQKYDHYSSSTNKYSRRISLNFNYRP